MWPLLLNLPTPAPWLSFLLSESAATWFTAFVALFTAVATILATLVTLAVAWLGYRLSQRTHALQVELQKQRAERDEQERARLDEQARRVREERELGAFEMKQLVARQNARQESVSSPQARFELLQLNSIGQRWSLKNVGDFEASTVRITDASIGVQGSWEVYPEGALADLKPGESVEVHVPSWSDGRPAQLAKVAWAEYHGTSMSSTIYLCQLILLERPANV